MQTFIATLLLALTIGCPKGELVSPTPSELNGESEILRSSTKLAEGPLLFASLTKNTLSLNIAGEVPPWRYGDISVEMSAFEGIRIGVTNRADSSARIGIIRKLAGVARQRLVQYELLSADYAWKAPVTLRVRVTTNNYLLTLK